jgi:serine/threonine protein phosphatase PrpC
MGSYLSTPKKDKVSSEGSGGGLLYGASEMQGWRLGMEDAYIANPVFPEQLPRELALFAVFDGHGGAEVSAYCRAHFARIFALAFRGGGGDGSSGSSGSSADQYLRRSLERAFMDMDVAVLSDGGSQELQQLSKTLNPPTPDLTLEDAAKHAIEIGAGVEQFAEFLVSDVGIAEVFAPRVAAQLMAQVTDGRAVSADAPAKDAAASGSGGGGVSSSSSDDDDDDDDDGGGGGDTAGDFVGPPRPPGEGTAAPDESDEEVEEDDSGGGGPTPGFHSGTTATVCLLVDGCKELVCANAGDSRCVLCRAGSAIDLSRDHKPEDDDELARITKAGGHVTDEGRVCGNLNLSRAIGDCEYKQNSELPAEEQMITAFPEIKSVTLEAEKDEFLVVACDGVWNCMSSQACVDFVRQRIADGMKPSRICEMICDECCAESSTDGDGSGLDNVTAMVVILPGHGEAPRSGGSSKVVGESRRRPDDNTQPSRKRTRVTVTEMDK